MLNSNRIKSSALRRLAVKGDASKINPQWLVKTQKIIAALQIAVSPKELDAPGFGWHELKGDRAGTYAVSVSRNWRITFRWDIHGPYDVDLEDYHGH